MTFFINLNFLNNLKKKSNYVMIVLFLLIKYYQVNSLTINYIYNFRCFRVSLNCRHPSS